MNIVRLTISYLLARPLANLLHVILLALGIAIITVLMLLHTQLNERMQRDAAGVDLIVGGKGSPLQLVLSSLYHLDTPTGNMKLLEAEKIAKHTFVKRSAPVALGDSFHGARIVGTTPSYIELYSGRLETGRIWQTSLEVVLGAEVAAHSKLRLGDKFSGAHGMVAGGTIHDEHEFVVVGILQPNGSVLDRLVLTALDSIWDVHHMEASTSKSTDPSQTTQSQEITALLVQYASPMAIAILPRLINQQTNLQAASPAFEMARLFKLVGIGATVFKAFGVVLLLSAALSVFVALFQAVRDRRDDLAMMRVLGASRLKVFSAILLEVISLSTLGVLLGILIGHLVTEGLGWWLYKEQQLMLTGWYWAEHEAWLFMLTWGVGVAAGTLPACLAYRQDVVSSLIED